MASKYKPLNLVFKEYPRKSVDGGESNWQLRLDNAVLKMKKAPVAVPEVGLDCGDERYGETLHNLREQGSIRYRKYS